MPKEYSRTERIEDLLQRELSQRIQHELQDPRLKLISITAVQISKDLAHAKVFFTQLKTQPDMIGLTQLLNRAAKHLRYHLAQTLELRVIPKFRFVYDTSLGEGARLSSLIDEAIHSDIQKHKE